MALKIAALFIRLVVTVSRVMMMIYLPTVPQPVTVTVALEGKTSDAPGRHTGEIYNRHTTTKEHVNVQSCLLINYQLKPISLKYSWLSIEQPIRIDIVLYKHYWEIPINKKIITMLTCPVNQGVDQVQSILSVFELLHLNWWRSNSGLQGLFD